MATGRSDAASNRDAAVGDLVGKPTSIRPPWRLPRHTQLPNEKSQLVQAMDPLRSELSGRARRLLFGSWIHVMHRRALARPRGTIPPDRHAMTDNPDNHVFAVEPLDLDRVYANYLRTCAMSGVEPVSRERAGELVCVAPERF